MEFVRPLLFSALVVATTLSLAQTPSPGVPAAHSGDAEIVQAAAHGNAGELRQLLQRGGNPRAAGPQGTPAIGYALLSKNPETLGVLLQADPSLAKTSLLDAHGKTHPVLAFAAAAKQPDMVAALLSAGAEAQGADAEGITILENAALGADARSMQLLIEAGASPNRRDIYGRSPLMMAAGSGNLEAARTLLEHDAAPYPLDTAGNSALSSAQSRLKDPAAAKAMVDLLVSHGAPPDGKNRAVDESYLDAVRAGDQPAVEAALAKGADVNARRKFSIDKGPGEPTALAVPHPKTWRTCWTTAQTSMPPVNTASMRCIWPPGGRATARVWSCW